jgi:hypothetical protein
LRAWHVPTFMIRQYKLITKRKRKWELRTKRKRKWNGKTVIWMRGRDDPWFKQITKGKQ